MHLRHFAFVVLQQTQLLILMPSHPDDQAGGESTGGSEPPPARTANLTGGRGFAHEGRLGCGAVSRYSGNGRGNAHYPHFFLLNGEKN